MIYLNINIRKWICRYAIIMGNAVRSCEHTKFIVRSNINVMKTFKTEEFSTSSVNRDTGDELNLEHFPDAKQILKEETELKMKDKIYRNLVLNELLDECGFNPSVASYLRFDKQFTLTVDIGLLKKIGILKNSTDLTGQFLSYLEEFPYDKNTKYQNKKYKTILSVKNSIEVQYLAWKFKVDVKFINLIFSRFQVCHLKQKSIRSMKRNLSLINLIQQTKYLDVEDKIFIINMTPFSVETLFNIKNNILGIRWENAVTLFPELMRKPYGYIFLILKILQSKNFSNNQIRKALPVLNLNILPLLKRLNYILSNNRLREHKKEVKFLKLLSFQHTVLSDLIEITDKSYHELIQILETHEVIKSKRKKVSTSVYWYQLQKNLKITEDTFKRLIRHPKLLAVPESQVIDTIKFLKQMKFTDEEISESITVVLYPRKSIKLALEKIHEERHNLAKIDFKDGWVPEETHFFKKGTKLRNKTLQLCLYYIEKDFDFSGAGVFFFDD